MAEKASGKAQGRSRPQTQSKGSNRSGQQKRNPDAGRGAGSRGSANGADQQKGRATKQRDEQGPGREEQDQEPSQQAEGQGGVGGTIRQHPITAAALGAGLTLLAAQGLRLAIGSGASGSGDDRDDHRDEEEGDSRGASASSEEDEGEEGEGGEDEESSGFTGRLGRIGSKVGSAFRGSGDAIRRGAQSGFARGRETAGEAWHNHPLFMCGVALAAGLTVGMLLPRTRQEDRLVGKTSDKVAGRFKKAGRELFQQGRSIANRALHEAVNSTASEAEREGLTPDRLGKKFKRVFSNVRDAVAESIQED